MKFLYRLCSLGCPLKATVYRGESNGQTGGSVKIRKPLYEGDSILRSGSVDDEVEISASTSSFEVSALAIVFLAAIYSISWVLAWPS